MLIQTSLFALFLQTSYFDQKFESTFSLATEQSTPIKVEARNEASSLTQVQAKPVLQKNVSQKAKLLNGCPEQKAQITANTAKTDPPTDIYAQCLAQINSLNGEKLLLSPQPAAKAPLKDEKSKTLDQLKQRCRPHRSVEPDRLQPKPSQHFARTRSQIPIRISGSAREQQCYDRHPSPGQYFADSQHQSCGTEMRPHEERLQCEFSQLALADDADQMPLSGHEAQEPAEYIRVNAQLQVYLVSWALGLTEHWYVCHEQRNSVMQQSF